jgi:biotin carboxyl carrier protein
MQVKVNDQYNHEVVKDGDGWIVNGNISLANISEQHKSSWHIIKDLKSYNVEVINFDPAEKTAELKINNNIYRVFAKDQYDLLLDKLGLSNLNAAKVSDIKAPMPGLVLKVFVEEGMEVKKGDNLFILEAMKMENIIKAPADVTVKTVKIKPGDKVEKGQVLLMF